MKLDNNIFKCCWIYGLNDQVKVLLYLEEIYEEMTE